MVSPHEPTRRIGEILIARHLITPQQLEQALSQQRSTKEFLGAILIRMGLIKPDTLLATLSEQFGIPQETVSPDRIDWTVVKQFPASILAERLCFPLRADAESVTVAIANPLDAWSLSAMENASGFRKIKPVLVLEAELRLLQQAYQERSLRDIQAHLNKQP